MQPHCQDLALFLQVVATNKVLAAQPYLCFFQGGPGFESPTPTEGLGWLAAAVKHFRVILLDQRGTGRSTPIRTSTLQAVGGIDAQVSSLLTRPELVPSRAR